MILLDTNVLIYASTERADFQKWARGVIAAGVSGDGASVNAITIAELCVGDAEPETVADRVRRWGLQVLDVPAAASQLCATSYVAYRERRRLETGRDAPAIPLPDFFIGAHAQVMGWPLATADAGRFRKYFPLLELTTP